MRATPEDLRRTYASLTDEQLLDLDPSELTDTALECYQQEMSRRRLAEGGTGQEKEPEHGERNFQRSGNFDGDWLEHAACACSFTVAPGSNQAEDAGRARQALLEAAIPCELQVIPGEPGARAEEIRVLVPDALNLKAMSLLDCEIFNPQLEADWRAHLAELSDQELAQLSPEVICAGLVDRVERLRRAYNDEIASRG